MVCVRCGKGITSAEAKSGNIDYREDKLGLYFYHRKKCPKVVYKK